MKAPRKIAALVAALVALFAFKASGQTANPNAVPAGLPASLPMFADTNQMLDAMVHQDVYSDMWLFYTARDGTTWSFKPVFSISTNFSSYSAYKAFLVSTMLGYINLALATNANPNGQVMVFSKLTLNNAPYTLSLIQVTNSSMSNVTSNWLMGLNPTIILLQVPVPNLQQFTIQVNGLYTNAWNGSLQMPTKPPYPPEGTTAGWLVLNPWYCLLGTTNEARFSVTASGKTQVYTQTGAPLLPPVLSMLDQDHLQVTMASGSDTTVQYASDLVSSWQTLSAIAWSTNSGTATITVNQPVQLKGNIVPPPTQRFFRALSN